jgi:hypothetical protein
MFNAENGSSCVTAKKSEVLAEVRKNRIAHEAAYKQALVDYKESAVLELTEMLEKAKAGKPFNRTVGAAPPPNHVRDYDRVIKMMEMSVKEELVLSENEFSNYVLDEWNWKQAFNQTIGTYSNKH